MLQSESGGAYFSLFLGDLTENSPKVRLLISIYYYLPPFGYRIVFLLLSKGNSRLKLSHFVKVTVSYKFVNLRTVKVFFLIF